MELKKFKKVLVANRGEIAIRVFRALNELGITTVGVFSKEDRYALFRSKADESYQLNPDKGPIDAYLDINTIIRIAKEKNVDAIHPGYGFLSENPDFVDACEDIQGEKIALSLKFPEENPWLKAEEKYKVGSVVTGKVARMTDFGAFVELESGIDALLHVSQIAKEHIDKPSDVLSVGQEIEAKVVDFKKDDKKISLSMKALANEEEKTEE